MSNEHRNRIRTWFSRKMNQRNADQFAIDCLLDEARLEKPNPFSIIIENGDWVDVDEIEKIRQGVQSDKRPI